MMSVRLSSTIESAQAGPVAYGFRVARRQQGASDEGRLKTSVQSWHFALDDHGLEGDV